MPKSPQEEMKLTKRVPCTLCPKSVTNLKSHMVMHRGEKLHNCESVVSHSTMLALLRLTFESTQEKSLSSVNTVTTHVQGQTI